MARRFDELTTAEYWVLLESTLEEMGLLERVDDVLMVTELGEQYIAAMLEDVDALPVMPSATIVIYPTQNKARVFVRYHPDLSEEEVARRVEKMVATLREQGVGIEFTKQ